MFKARATRIADGFAHEVDVNGRHNGSGRSTSVTPAVPAASSVTTTALIRHLPMR